jgi:hypothetical protein
MPLDDVLDLFNLIDRAEGWLAGALTLVPHRHRNGAWHWQPGMREIRVDRASNTGGEAERCLARYHIPVHGRRITSAEAIFLVRASQAEFAEYNLPRAGLVLGPQHRMINPDNARWAARHNGPAPAWDDRERS